MVRFLSQLLDDRSSTFHEILDLVGDTGTQEAYKLLHQQFPQIPEPLRERIAVATNSFVHAAALRAARPRHEQIVDDELFRRNLVDMFLGAVTQ
jgi:hypothetical protein